MRDPPARVVAAAEMGQRHRRRYELDPPGEPATWQRDALISSVLAYSGLRPGELRALRWSDVREHTILVQRAANPDGSSKPTKNERRRSVRLLAPLAQDLREYRLAMGRPPADRLLLRDDEDGPWDKNAWQGHSVAVLLETYAHLIEEYAEAERIDAELEIASARRREMFGESSADAPDTDRNAPLPKTKPPR